MALSRGQVFAIRLAATLVVLGLVFAFIRAVWLPGGYFAITGIHQFLWIMVGAAIVLGPVLSAAFYKPGKPRLKFDLTVLALLEIGAIGWGLYEINERRPIFSVMAVDRFVTVTANDIDAAELQEYGFATHPGAGPTLVSAALPTDVDTMNQLIDDTIFYGKKDIDQRPEFWQPYSAGIASLRSKAPPLAAYLELAGDNRPIVERWIARHTEPDWPLGYVAVRGRARDAVMVIHAELGYPIGIIDVDPWLRSPPQNSDPASDVEETH